MTNDETSRIGTVIEFDEHVGLGAVEADGERFLFHCVEILDGSRRIDVGATVTFVPVMRFGHREASVVAIRP